MQDSMAKLQYTFQEAILKKFKTGHLLVDYLLTSAIFEPVGAFCSYRGYLNYVWQTLQRLFRFFRWLAKVMWSFWVSRGRTLTCPTSRLVEIHYITSKSRKNHVYEKVQWFLESVVETTNESRLMVYCEDALAPDHHPGPADLQKAYPVKQAKTYAFAYQGKTHDIHFEFTKAMVTVYGDKERQKEDLIINLWVEDTQSLEDADNDVLEAFIQMCIAEHRKFYAGAALKPVLHTIQGDNWVARPWRNRRNLSTILLKDGQMDEIKDQLDWFVANEDWYAERGLPYKLVFLFHGPPGTGKSALMNAVSHYLKRPFRHNLSLATIHSDKTFSALTSKIDYSNSVVYCDDLDSLNDVVLDRAFHKDDTESSTQEQTSTLKLGTLLEWMDGYMCHGMVAGFMTNFPERLDAAFIREGRIDVSLRLDFCDHYQLAGLFHSFYGRVPDGAVDPSWSPAHLSPAAVQKVFRMRKNRNNPEEALASLRTYKPHYEDIHTTKKPFHGGSHDMPIIGAHDMPIIGEPPIIGEKNYFLINN